MATGRTPHYLRCSSCGHEVLSDGQQQGFIVNDPVTYEDTNKRTGLDRFKRSVLKQVAKGHEITLADIGSATGRFLFQNKDIIEEGWGVEVTPEALEFSRKTLGLNVVENAKELPPNLSVVTAWHSLEHIPERELLSVIENVASKLKQDGHFIISVPNADSNQYQWYGTSYAYYDMPNHLHQFTNTSLDLIMGNAGFQRTGNISSSQYNHFGHIQSILNVLTNSHNYLYYQLKRKQGSRNLFLDAANLLFLPVALCIGTLLTAFDLLKPQKQGVITACYQHTT